LAVLVATIFVANVLAMVIVRDLASLYDHSGNIARKRALFISALIGIGRKKPHRIIQHGWWLRASA
jgi:hypothetical protein